MQAFQGPKSGRGTQLTGCIMQRCPFKLLVKPQATFLVNIQREQCTHASVLLHTAERQVTKPNIWSHLNEHEHVCIVPLRKKLKEFRAKNLSVRGFQPYLLYRP